jgi:lysine 6-dehydrogenase
MLNLITMKVLVLGIGKMGYGLLKDLVAQKEVEEVVAADANIEAAKAVTKRVNSEKVKGCEKLDVTDKKATVKLIKGFDIVAAAIPRTFCNQAISATIEAGVSWADIAADFNTVFGFNDSAKKAGVTIVPHIGLDVGTDRVLLGVGSRKLDNVDKLYVACGGFPQKGTPGFYNPLSYKISWSWPFAISGSLGTCKILKNGKTIDIKVLSDPTPIEFPEPLGRLEAFTNSGLMDTVEHLGLKGVEEAYGQTIRWPGHCEMWTKLKELHLMDKESLKVKGVDVSPLDFWVAFGDKYLQYEADEGDAICQRVIVRGKKDGVPAKYTYEFVEFQDFKNDLSAMAKTTAFPCSIVAQMIAKGQMEMPGVIHPAKIGYDEKLSDTFFAEMARRDIKITESFTSSFN